jgi:hypothetical protein
MATTRFLLGIICYACTGSLAMSESTLLKIIPDQVSGARQRLIHVARQELGVRELTGHNDGLRVEEYLKLVKLKKGNPYCAAFVSWVFAQAGYPMPRTAWSPALFPDTRLTQVVLPGDIFGVYFPEYGRIAHVGIVERLDGDYCISLEANTNPGGSNEGDGVYRRRRLTKTLRKFADWISPGRRLP